MPTDFKFHPDHYQSPLSSSARGVLNLLPSPLIHPTRPIFRRQIPARNLQISIMAAFWSWRTTGLGGGTTHSRKSVSFPAQLPSSPPDNDNSSLLRPHSRSQSAMDAVDLDWCLACGCRIEMDCCTRYCSNNCLNADTPSTSAHPLHHTLPSIDERESFHTDADDDSYLNECFPDPQPSSPIRNSWIGQGDAGIRAWAQAIPRGAPCESEDSPSRTLKPKLLLQPRKPVKPFLYMSRAQPAPPGPSRPILTPQQSLPSVSRDLASIPSTSVVSLTAGSSSYSIVTPTTTSEVGSFRDAPVPRSTAQPHNLLGGFKAQLRAWATSSTPQKEAPESSTQTRAPAIHIADDSEVESALGYASKVRRPRSLAPFFHTPERSAREKSK